MNAEQKKIALECIRLWGSEDLSDCAGDQMAALLQELVDAPTADTLLTWAPNDDTGDITDADGNEYYFARENAVAMCRVVMAAHAPEPEPVATLRYSEGYGLSAEIHAPDIAEEGMKLYAAPPAEIPETTNPAQIGSLPADESAAYESWFAGEQGKPYSGMWDFAKAAWMARAETPADVARDAELLGWLEQEAKESRTGVSIVYKNQADDEGGIKRGYRLMRYHQIFSARLNLREAIDAAIAVEKGQS